MTLYFLGLKVYFLVVDIRGEYFFPYSCNILSVQGLRVNVEMPATLHICYSAPGVTHKCGKDKLSMPNFQLLFSFSHNKAVFMEWVVLFSSTVL